MVRKLGKDGSGEEGGEEVTCGKARRVGEVG